jgi:hypothetical protein
MLGQEATFWTSTPNGTGADSQVYNWIIRNNSGGLGNGFFLRNAGYAVRCVRD